MGMGLMSVKAIFASSTHIRAYSHRNNSGSFHDGGSKREIWIGEAVDPWPLLWWPVPKHKEDARWTAVIDSWHMECHKSVTCLLIPHSAIASNYYSSSRFGEMFDCYCYNTSVCWINFMGNCGLPSFKTAGQKRYATLSTYQLWIAHTSDISDAPLSTQVSKAFVGIGTEFAVFVLWLFGSLLSQWHQWCTHNPVAGLVQKGGPIVYVAGWLLLGLLIECPPS